MRCSSGLLAAVLLTFASHASAAVITFDTDPFAGSDALTTPGRQLVGGELFTTFDPATDLFAFDANVFGVSSILLGNGEVGALPSAGLNTVVLRTFDNDSDPTTPFNAGIAATLIANHLTDSTPGFFIYFNSGLNLPRLVFSTDLGDPTADLKVLARMTNLTGQSGRDALASFTAANFVAVPEPTATLLLATGALVAATRYRWRGRTPRQR